MKVLVTGAKGFVGKNLVCALKNVQEGKDRTRGDLQIEQIWEYDLDTPASVLDEACAEADFVFHLAGVNRPKDKAEFMTGNAGFTETLLQKLRDCGNRCPVMLSSSTQASLLGRFAGSDYGASKLAAEKEFFAYAAQTGAEVLVYRFPNLFGKWCRPGYNSAVATFCHNVARDLPITVSDPAVELELVYIDDLVDELLLALRGKAHRCELDGLTPVPKPDGAYCCVPVSHRATLGQIVDLLRSFRAQPDTLLMPPIPDGSFAKKLYATYLSDLPRERVSFPLRMNCDARGSFTELLRTEGHGQRQPPGDRKGRALAQHKVGVLHRRLRTRSDPGAKDRERRGVELRGQRRPDRGGPYAPRLHPQHHQSVPDRKPGHADVGKRMLRPQPPGHLPRGRVRKRRMIWNRLNSAATDG